MPQGRQRRGGSVSGKSGRDTRRETSVLFAVRKTRADFSRPRDGNAVAASRQLSGCPLGFQSVSTVKKVKREAAAQRRPARSERKNRVFSAKRQAVWENALCRRAGYRGCSPLSEILRQMPVVL